jgi:hypothetical protein
MWCAVREMASPNIFSSIFLLINNATQLNVSGHNQSVESEIRRQSTNCQMNDIPSEKFLF